MIRHLAGIILLFLFCITIQATAFASTSIKEFGAIGYGLADDKAAFEAAQGEVFVPAGIYLIRAGLWE